MITTICLKKELVIKQYLMNKIGLLKNEEATMFILDYSTLDSNALLG